MRPLVFVLFLATAALAQANIVSDPGFESAGLSCNFVSGGYTGNIDGSWSATQGTISICDSADGLGAVPHSGEQFAYLDFASTVNTLSQTLTTTPGQEYEITFWLADTYANPVAVYFGADAFYGSAPRTVSQVRATTRRSPYTLLATSTSTVLSFSGYYSDGFGTLLDDVSVSPVPEPGTLGIAAVALLGVFIARKRHSAVR